MSPLNEMIIKKFSFYAVTPAIYFIVTWNCSYNGLYRNND